MQLADRFASKYDVAADGCWVWNAARTGSGYGNLYVGRGADGRKKYAPAHRVAYELLVGPIPAGLSLDHLCRNRSCINPQHLEPVTVAENNRRAMKARVAA